MRLASLFRQFLDDLRAQRMRTLMTIFGITWGTVAVVVLLAFGTGLERQMKKNSRGMGEAIVIVFGGRTTRAFDGFPQGRPVRLQEEDVALLTREIPEIAAISPEYSTWSAPVRVGEKVANPNVSGVLPVYSEMRNVFPQAGGRWLNELDVERRRRVAFLGDSLKHLLFGEEDAVGRQVLIGGGAFTVIGVLQTKSQNSSYSSRDEDRVFIPASTFRAVFGARTLNNIVYLPSDPSASPAIRAKLFETLGRKYKFDPQDDDALGVWDTTEGQKIFNYIFLGFNLFLGVVGSFTLTVGGIGVANIMYIVVRERTREIGVKRSLGARRRDILNQFLIETGFIVAIGAGLGMLISVVLVALVGMLPIDEFVGTPVISPLVLSATLGLLALIALLAGLFPARKAANLDPVESLRYGA